jgi:hypothetical protein
MCKMLDLPLQNDTVTDEGCPYCKKLHHTLKQCWLRKSDETLKDEVNTLIPSLKKIYKAQQDLLQQKGKFTTDQGKMMKSILRTLQEMTIGGNTMETLMSARVHHQGETNYPNKEDTPEHTQEQGIPKRGGEDENHQNYGEDQDYQEHERYITEQDDGRDDDYSQQYESQNEEGEDDGQDDYEDEYEPQDEGGNDYDEESQECEPQDEGGDDDNEESQEYEPQDEGEYDQDEDRNRDGDGDETDNSQAELVASFSSNDSTDD